MGKANLVAHVDSHYVPEAVVRAEPEPEFTKSWHPWSHGQVIDAVSAACKQTGFEVGQKRFAIKPGSKMFAAWDIVKRPAGAVAKTDDFCLSLGIRNSINKSFSVGLCAGERVFVCDNLVFSGSVVLFRKHTGMLELEEITMLAAEALKELGPKFDRTLEWHNGLMETKLTDAQASLLMMALIRRRYPIVPPSQLPEFSDLYFADDSKYTRTLHGIHGAVTEWFKRTDPVDLIWKTQWLVRFLDYEVPEIIGTGKEIVDLHAIQEQAEEKSHQALLEDKSGERKAAQEIKLAVREKIAEAKKAENGTKKPGPKPKAEKAAKRIAKAEKELKAAGLMAEDPKAPKPASVSQAAIKKAAPKAEVVAKVHSTLATKSEVQRELNRLAALKGEKPKTADEVLGPNAVYAKAKPKLREIDKAAAEKRKAAAADTPAKQAKLRAKAREKSNWKTTPAPKKAVPRVEPLKDWMAEEIEALEKKGI